MQVLRFFFFVVFFFFFLVLFCFLFFCFFFFVFVFLVALLLLLHCYHHHYHVSIIDTRFHNKFLQMLVWKLWVKKKKKKLFSHEPITENIFISINHIRSSQKLWKRLGKFLYYPCAVVLVSCVWYILSCKWSMEWQQVFVY